MALCALAPSASAAQAEALVVYPTDGRELVFFLGEHPAFSYSDTHLSIESSSAKAQISLAQAGTMKFEMRQAASLKPDAEAVRVDLSDPAAVRITGLQPGCRLSAATLGGINIGSCTAGADGTACLDLSGIAAGNAVIVSSNSLTFKLIKK